MDSGAARQVLGKAFESVGSCSPFVLLPDDEPFCWSAALLWFPRAALHASSLPLRYLFPPRSCAYRRHDSPVLHTTMNCIMRCGTQAHRGQARAVFVRHDVETAYGDKSNLSREHNVRAVPCFLFFDGGAVVSARGRERPGAVQCGRKWEVASNSRRSCYRPCLAGCIHGVTRHACCTLTTPLQHR